MSASGTGGAANVDPCGGADPTEPNNSRDNSTPTFKAGGFAALGDASGPGEVLPDHFTRKYKLTVSQ